MLVHCCFLLFSIIEAYSLFRDCSKVSGEFSGEVRPPPATLSMVARGGGRNHGLVVSDQIVRLKNIVFVVVRLDMRLCILSSVFRREQPPWPCAKPPDVACLVS
jgi:hypothetical protein